MPLAFKPPLLNSATPWATSREDIQSLYNSRFTGAVTIRTCQSNGYPHDDGIHQFCFTDIEHSITEHSANQNQLGSVSGGAKGISSLNTLVYSPIPISEYVGIVRDILSREQGKAKKPIIFSVAGSIAEIREYYSLIHRLSVDTKSRLLLEVNLACPNLAGKPPPAYSEHELTAYLQAMADAIIAVQQTYSSNWSTEYDAPCPLEIGLKTPPYTYRDQFAALISALQAVKPCPITFITATNTLGSSLLLSDSLKPALNSEHGTGIGGLAGAALHPLALGNVKIIRSMLDEQERLNHISIIGVGGVLDRGGYRRMLAVGSEAVAVGTALGSEGLGVFSKILNGLETVDQDTEVALDEGSPGSAEHAPPRNDPLTDGNGLPQVLRNQVHLHHASSIPNKD